MVVQFRSNNPGYWFIPMIIQEAVEKAKKPPKEMEYCDPFINNAFENQNGSGSIAMPSISAILIIEFLVTLYAL